MKNEIANLKSIPSHYLIIGGGSFILGTVINYLSYNLLIASEQLYLNYPLFNQFAKLNILILFLLIVIIAPIVEEIAFRGWTTETRFRKLIATSLITFYSYLSFQSLLVSILLYILLLLLFFKLKKNQLYIMTFITSAIFSLIHLPNFESSSMITGSIIQLFGVGIVLVYFSRRFGLIYSILLHASYNCMLLFSLSNTSDSSAMLKFEGATFYAETKPVNIFQTREVSLDEDNQINITDYLSEICVHLSPFKPDYMYRSQVNSLEKHNLTVSSKPNNKINREDLLQQFIKVKHITTDTVIRPAKTLEINATNHNFGHIDSSYKTRLYDIIKLIRTKFDIPLTLSSKIDNQVYYIATVTLTMNFEEYQSYLEKNHGLIIRETTDMHIKEVVFFTGDN